jgi:hypothetical protein
MSGGMEDPAAMAGLEPDHPLLQKAQQALKAQLLESKQRVEAELRKKNNMLRVRHHASPLLGWCACPHRAQVHTAACILPRAAAEPPPPPQRLLPRAALLHPASVSHPRRQPPSPGSQAAARGRGRRAVRLPAEPGQAADAAGADAADLRVHQRHPHQGGAGAGRAAQAAGTAAGAEQA